MLFRFKSPTDAARQGNEAENESLREQLNTALIRFELAGKTEGLWDMEYPKDGQLRPDTPFWWSERFRNLLGFTDEREFPNVLDSWGSRLLPSDSERTFAAFKAHLTDRTGRTPYDIEYQLKMKTGEYRWFQARGYTHRDRAGNPLRVNGSLRDITAEKLLDQKLRSSRNNLQSAITDVRSSMAALLQKAVDTAEGTNTKMDRLDSRSKEIRKFTRVISEIAQTSNTLALNAMIEAARSGDAGVGFAVVADEVKRLAGTTANATKDITKETECIGGDIAEVASAISRFQDIIQQIQTIQDKLSTTIEAETNDILA